MLGEGIYIGKAFGITLRLHYSWFVIFVLVTWALAGSYFPTTYPTWSPVQRITAGILTSLMFFGSVLLHELMHSIVAQRQGIGVRSIVLFIFGGVSQMTEEPKQPKHEFNMALAGPLTSLVLGGIFWGIRLQFVNIQFVAAIAQWLGTINLFLGLFNLLPGFPLDGGRVLRSILWWRSRNLRKATRTASYVGRAVAYIFISGGIFLIFQGNFFNGLWIALIGWFLQNAATDSYRQMILQDTLQGHTVSEVMTRDCLFVPPELSVERLVNEYILASGRRCFPVVADGRILGLVTIHNVKMLPRQQWGIRTARDVMTTFDKVKAVGPNADLYTVLRLLTEEDVAQLPVIQDHNILGMIGRDHILAFVNVRGELGH